MPELPEVETVVRSMVPRLVGRRILAVELRKSRVLKTDLEETIAGLTDRKVTGIQRHGKFIVVKLDRGYLTIHLGMTGKVLFNVEPEKHTHAIFTLDRGTMLYNDPRMFGALEYSPDLLDRVARLGPEPLEVTAAEFADRLKRHRTRIKALLLNQDFVRGVGNIYADEALFRARIHPLAMASKLRRPRIERLHAAMVEVLKEAIASKGSSVSSYVDAEGRKGSFQNEHRVYQRTGEPCVVCGTPIRRTLVAQRGTHYCPKCQRI